jgi:hypothetical protein
VDLSGDGEAVVENATAAAALQAHDELVRALTQQQVNVGAKQE